MSDFTLTNDQIARRHAVMTRRNAIIMMRDADRTDADYAEFDRLGVELDTLLPPWARGATAMPSSPEATDWAAFAVADDFRNDPPAQVGTPGATTTFYVAAPLATDDPVAPVDPDAARDAFVDAYIASLCTGAPGCGCPTCDPGDPDDFVTGPADRDAADRAADADDRDPVVGLTLEQQAAYWSAQADANAWRNDPPRRSTPVDPEAAPFVPSDFRPAAMPGAQGLIVTADDWAATPSPLMRQYAAQVIGDLAAQDLTATESSPASGRFVHRCRCGHELTPFMARGYAPRTMVRRLVGGETVDDPHLGDTAFYWAGDADDLLDYLNRDPTGNGRPLHDVLNSDCCVAGFGYGSCRGVA